VRHGGARNLIRQDPRAGKTLEGDGYGNGDGDDPARERISDVFPRLKRWATK